MKEARRIADPEAGRSILHLAYSLGCLAELGAIEASGMLTDLCKAAGNNRNARYALLDQFRMGERHERQHGEPTDG